MANKVNCRKAFTSILLQKAKQDSNIFAVATDSSGSVTLTDFVKSLPEQFVELGIAEQNAVGISAGLALSGKNVFVCGSACFLSARAYEQVKVDVAYNNCNVKVFGVSGGVSYGPLGGTHTSLHDIAGMRALANLQVFLPSDAVQTNFLVAYLAEHLGPAYIRVGRGDVDEIYQESESFEIGKAKMVYSGTDLTIIACGEMVSPSKRAAEKLMETGISVRLLDMFTIKPLDIEAIKNAAAETKCILTVEEHSENGGLGEAVAHVVAECPVPIKIMGFPDEEIPIGSSTELFQHFGFSAEQIAHNAQILFER